MLHRLATTALQSGAEFLEIGLMAAASPEFAAAMSQQLLEKAVEAEAEEPSPGLATPVRKENGPWPP